MDLGIIHEGELKYQQRNNKDENLEEILFQNNERRLQMIHLKIEGIKFKNSFSMYVLLISPAGISLFCYFHSLIRQK